MHHWNNRDPNIRNQKKYHNIRQEKYKTHNNIDKSYREHSYLLRCGNRRNGGVFFVLLKIMLKKFTRKFNNKKLHIPLSNFKVVTYERIRFTGLSQLGQLG